MRHRCRTFPQAPAPSSTSRAGSDCAAPLCVRWRAGTIRFQLPELAGGIKKTVRRIRLCLASAVPLQDVFARTPVNLHSAVWAPPEWFPQHLVTDRSPHCAKAPGEACLARSTPEAGASGIGSRRRQTSLTNSAAFVSDAMAIAGQGEGARGVRDSPLRQPGHPADGIGWRRWRCRREAWRPLSPTRCPCRPKCRHEGRRRFQGC